MIEHMIKLIAMMNGNLPQDSNLASKTSDAFLIYERFWTNLNLDEYNSAWQHLSIAENF